jgi:DNA-binding LacI/PurR family transcriptional regulator
MSINMKSVAAKAGVSVATVSRALNKPEMVHPVTREKILAIVKELGYAPNPFAQGLSTGKTRLIALIVPTLNNSFFGQLADGCQSYLTPEGYNLIIYSFEEYGHKELGIIQEIDQRRIEGIILSGSGFYLDNYQDVLNKITIPVVLVENSPEVTDISSVYIDDVAGLTMAAQFLINQGHKQIGIIAGPEKMLTTDRRVKAVKSVFKEYNINMFEKYIVYGEYASLESGADALQKLMRLKQPPSAILAFNDILAIGALKSALQLGINIPKELAVIGFDDIPMAAYYSPALSTIHSPSLDLGKHAARLLLEKLGNAQAPIKKVLLPVELILRETT